MPFVSTVDKICPQTQKNAKFWVWSVFISNIEKIYSKTSILPLKFTGYWAWERIVCHICPNHMLFCGVSLTAIYDLIRPPNLVRTSCNTWDSYPTKFVIEPIFSLEKQKKLLRPNFLEFPGPGETIFLYRYFWCCKCRIFTQISK